MSSNARDTWAETDSSRSAARRLMMSFSRSSRSGAQFAAAATDLARSTSPTPRIAASSSAQRAAAAQVAVNGHLVVHRQLAVVKGRQSTPGGDARQRLHTDLSSRSFARNASRARVSRDFTVPIAIPSENAISS